MTWATLDAVTTPPELPGRRRVSVPFRVGAFVALFVVVLVVTSSGSVRSWWAHRLHDLTGGSWGGDYMIGVVIGLLPLIGVVVAALRRRHEARHRLARALRMLGYGAVGFVVTYLLSPSPAGMLSHDSTKVFDHSAPGYLAGVFTGAVVWLAALVVAILRARSWWRRLTGQPPAARSRAGVTHDGHRVIDV